jgi:hypothetical protein
MASNDLPCDPGNASTPIDDFFFLGIEDNGGWPTEVVLAARQIRTCALLDAHRDVLLID